MDNLGKAGKKVLNAIAQTPKAIQTQVAQVTQSTTPLSPSKPAQPSSTQGSSSSQSAAKPITLLVIQSDDYDWQAIFQTSKLADGRPIAVVQCGWEDILVNADAYSRHRISVTIRKNKRPFPASLNKSGNVSALSITIKPDFCLIRNEVYMPHADYRNLLYGLMFAGVPSVNSLQSIYMFCERPIVQGELNRVARELGRDMFPIVEQSYFNNHSALMYGNSFPAVVKIGAAHAGVGKMRIIDHHHMEDFRSVLAMTEGKYCTVEPFLDGEFDLRIQKIGQHYRAFKRMSLSGTWKTNTGSSHLEQIPCTEKYQIWADKASQFFGGLDILTVDALHCRDSGQERILEVNGTSSGLAPDFADEDNVHIRELVLEKMNLLFC